MIQKFLLEEKLKKHIISNNAIIINPLNTKQTINTIKNLETVKYIFTTQHTTRTTNQTQ